MRKHVHSVGVQLSTFNFQPSTFNPYEQVAAWFQNRDKVGIEINWPKGGVYQRPSQLPLLPGVQTVLKRHSRYIT